MKTSKKDFARFKKEFLRWVGIFGLKDYRLVFRHLELKDDFASININEEGKLAIVKLATGFEKESDDGWVSPEHHARHEAIHLLLNRFDYLARARVCSQSEITEENETITRILEKVLK